MEDILNKDVLIAPATGRGVRSIIHKLDEHGVLIEIPDYVHGMDSIWRFVPWHNITFIELRKGR